jgi:transglutaminase-like putative cysteine protease
VRIVAEDPAESFRLPQRDARFSAELASDPFVQSDDPRIRRAAEDALGGETDAARAARKLLEWVNRNVAQVPMVTVPTAVGVLDSRQGDCNEHAVLYTALARAAGLPARIAAGTVYMPGEGGLPGAFYYHAWVEVWLGEWVAVDPTFGQFPADATHVKLVEGGPERHADLLGLIGRLSFSVEGTS